jgi:hypothetical protein
MKNMALLVLSVSTLMCGTIHAATISAQPLKCGGFVSLDSDGSKIFLTVKKVAQSTCQTVEVDSQHIRGPIRGGGTQFPVKNLGSQLVVIVDNEVVVLNTTMSSTDIEQQRLQIEKQRNARERSKANAEVAADSVDAAIAVGEVGTDAVNSIER